MSIDFKFRNLEPSDAIKAYAADKLGKFQKYLRAPLGGQVSFSVERHMHCVDVSVSSGGEHFQGSAEEEDMYAAIDLVVDKLQRQINRLHGQHSNHRRGPQPSDAPTE